MLIILIGVVHGAYHVIFLRDDTVLSQVCLPGLKACYRYLKQSNRVFKREKKAVTLVFDSEAYHWRDIVLDVDDGKTALFAHESAFRQCLKKELGSVIFASTQVGSLTGESIFRLRAVSSRFLSAQFHLIYRGLTRVDSLACYSAFELSEFQGDALDLGLAFLIFNAMKFASSE